MLYPVIGMGMKKSDYVLLLVDNIMETPSETESLKDSNDQFNPLAALTVNMLEKIYSGKKELSKRNAGAILAHLDMERFNSFIANYSFDVITLLGKQMCKSGVLVNEKIDEIAEKCSEVFVDVLQRATSDMDSNKIYNPHSQANSSVTFNNMLLESDLGKNIADFLSCNEGVADLYINILQGPKEKESLFNQVGLSSKAFESAIELLSSRCLISDDIGRDRKIIYFAIDPQFSFPSIILTEMWAIDTELHTVSDLLRRKDLHQLKARHQQCQNIVDIAKKFYKKQLPFQKEMTVVINGYKRIASYISELLKTATTDIYAAISPPHLLGEIVWHTVVEKMNEGVNYQRITTFHELVRHGYEIYKNEISNYNETLYIYKNESLTGKFYIVDDVSIVFFAPKGKDFKFEVQVSTNAAILERSKTIY